MGGKVSQKAMLKRKERSRARAEIWHKRALQEGTTILLETMEAYRIAPIPMSIPAGEKQQFKETKEILALKLARSVKNLKNSQTKDYIVEKITRAAIVYDSEGTYMEKFKIKWAGFAEQTWEPRYEFEFNEAVDEFFRQVHLTPTHELNSGQVWIHVDNLSTE